MNEKAKEEGIIGVCVSVCGGGRGGVGVCSGARCVKWPTGLGFEVTYIMIIMICYCLDIRHPPLPTPPPLKGGGAEQAEKRKGKETKI